MRNNPTLAIVLIVVALILLGASIYWTFLRPASPSSPFAGQEAQPSDTVPAPEPGKDEGPGVVL